MGPGRPWARKRLAVQPDSLRHTGSRGPRAGGRGWAAGGPMGAGRMGAGRAHLNKNPTSSEYIISSQSRPTGYNEGGTISPQASGTAPSVPGLLHMGPTCEYPGKCYPGACLIPGSLNTYPANYDVYNVCGGQGAIVQQAWQSTTSSGEDITGSVTVFRDFNNGVYVTVQLDGAAEGQWLFQSPAQGRSWASSLVLWNASIVDVPDTLNPPAYMDPSGPGNFACFTQKVDLEHVYLTKFNIPGDGTCAAATGQQALAVIEMPLNRINMTCAGTQPPAGVPAPPPAYPPPPPPPGINISFYGVQHPFNLQPDCVDLIFGLQSVTMGVSSDLSCSVRQVDGGSHPYELHYSTALSQDIELGPKDTFWNVFWKSSLITLNVDPIFNCASDLTLRKSTPSRFNRNTCQNLVGYVTGVYVNVTTLRAWRCLRETNNLVQVQATLASQINSDSFLIISKDPDTATNMARSPLFSLTCEDTINMESLACGGPEAAVVWNQTNLPYLSCFPQPPLAPNEPPVIESPDYLPPPLGETYPPPTVNAPQPMVDVPPPMVESPAPVLDVPPEELLPPMEDLPPAQELPPTAELASPPPDYPGVLDPPAIANDPYSPYVPYPPSPVQDFPPVQDLPPTAELASPPYVQDLPPTAELASPPSVQDLPPTAELASPPSVQDLPPTAELASPPVDLSPPVVLAPPTIVVNDPPYVYSPYVPYPPDPAVISPPPQKQSPPPAPRRERPPFPPPTGRRLRRS
eukprot:gene21605-28605_t